MIRTYHPNSLKSPYDKFKIADIGDCPVNPVDVQDSLEKITNSKIYELLTRNNYKLINWVNSDLVFVNKNSKF